MRVRAGDEVLVWRASSSSECWARTPRCCATSPARRSRERATSRRSPTSPTTGPRGHTVLTGDFVTTEDGTGIVHTALAFGEDDFRLGEQYEIKLQNPVRADGTFDERVTDFEGRSRSRTPTREIVESLRERGRLFRVGDLRALLPALLALRHAAALLREVELVHPHDRGPRPDAGRERDDRLAPRARQARALRQVARGQRRLGPLARALLGHAAADLGVRVGRLRGRLLRRLDRRAARARRRGPRRPAPALHRRGDRPLRGLRRGDAAGRGGDRRLVRLGRDAVRAVPLPVRERGRVRASASRPTTSARPRTRPGAGSTRCSPSRCCSPTAPATATASASA